MTRKAGFAERILKAMAYDREEQVNKMESALSGAIMHFYRIRLALLNERTDQVEKWEKQELGFLDQFIHKLTHATKGKWDRRKAAAQALVELREENPARRRGETAMFQEVYQLASVQPLPPEVDDEFFSHVQQIVDYYYPSKQKNDPHVHFASD